MRNHPILPILTLISIFLAGIACTHAPQIAQPVAVARSSIAATAVEPVASSHVDPSALTGIDWHHGIETVLGQDRPILLFQLLGDFDDAFC